jgi:hypothetical protein
MEWSEVLKYLVPALLTYILASWRAQGDSSKDHTVRLAVLFEKVDQLTKIDADQARDIKAIWSKIDKMGGAQ